MKHNRYFLLTRTLLLISLVLSCDRQKTEDPGSKTQPPSTQAEALSLRTVKNDFGLIYEFVENGLILPGQTRASIIASIGNPDSTAARALQNLHNPEVTDSVIVMYYKNLEVGIYNVGFDKREFIINALVKDNQYLKYTNLRIGTDIATLESILGKPSNINDSAYVYVCEDCMESTVKFLISHGMIKSVEFSYTID